MSEGKVYGNQELSEYEWQVVDRIKEMMKILVKVLKHRDPQAVKEDLDPHGEMEEKERVKLTQKHLTPDLPGLNAYEEAAVIGQLGSAILAELATANSTGSSSMPNKGNEENVRTEYSAICSKLNGLASFRFTLIGFYVAAMGLIVSRGYLGDNSAGPTWPEFLFVIFLSICFWIVDLRTRAILANMSDRAKQIEASWGYEGFISRWKKMGDGSSDDGLTKVEFFKWKTDLFTRFFSHSLGIDLLFLILVGYSIYKIVVLVYR